VPGGFQSLQYWYWNWYLVLTIEREATSSRRQQGIAEGPTVTMTPGMLLQYSLCCVESDGSAITEQCIVCDVDAFEATKSAVLRLLLLPDHRLGIKLGIIQSGHQMSDITPLAQHSC